MIYVYFVYIHILPVNLKVFTAGNVSTHERCFVIKIGFTVLYL